MSHRRPPRRLRNASAERKAMRDSFAREYDSACDRMRRIAVLGVLDIAARDGATASIVTFYEGGPESGVLRRLSQPGLGSLRGR